MAGSSPNWTTGYIPSAAEWNTLWGNKADYGSLVLAQWTAATRPASPTSGQTGFNTTTGALETWNGAAWVSASSGGGGSSTGYVAPVPTGIDDTAAVQTLLNTIGAASGGKLTLLAGNYITTGLVFPSNVWIDGQGQGVTTLQMKAGTATANNAVLMGSASATSIAGNPYSLFGTLSPTMSQGVGLWKISNLTIDGNKSGGSACDGLAAYGWAWSAENVEIKNCARDGLHTEYGALPGNISTENVQAFASWVEVHDCDVHGIRFGGPNDTVFLGCNSYRNLGINLWLAAPAGTVKWIGGHCWGSDVVTGRQPTYGCQMDTASNLLQGSHFEGSTSAQIWVRANNNVIDKCFVYYNQVNKSTAQSGLVLGDAGGGVPVIGNKINLWAENVGAGAIFFSNDGGDNDIEFFGISGVAGAFGYSGVHAASTRVKGAMYGAPNNTTIWYEPLQQAPLYSLVPLATLANAGLVTPDGSSIHINATGTISAPAGVAITNGTIAATGTVAMGSGLTLTGSGSSYTLTATGSGGVAITNGTLTAGGTLTVGTGLTLSGSGTSYSLVSTGGFSGGTVSGATTFSATGTALTVSNSALIGTLSLTNPLATNYGGLGYDGHLAPVGSFPMGNGSGYVSAAFVAGSGISITPNATSDTLTIAATGGGGSFTGGTVAGATTFSATGTALTVTNSALIGTLSLTNPLATNYGGLGFNGATAVNGAIPIGNGSGFVLSTVSGTANNLTVTNGAGTITLKASANQLPGTATNDSASAGNLGELISQNIPNTSAVSLTTGTTANIASRSLTAGDWDVSGNLVVVADSSTTISWIYTATTTTSATLPAAPNEGGYASCYPNGVAGLTPVLCVGPMRLSLASTTTVYLVANVGFTPSLASAYGFLRARRVR